MLGDRTIMSKRFGYAIDNRYLPLLLLFGLRRSKDGVTLTDEGSLLATFGFVKIKTPQANVTGAHITRNYRWWTAFGVRASMVDDGLSFGTNHSAGVCIHFAEKVPSPLRRSGHSALTVTVADLEGLTNALGAEPGETSSTSSP
jgi:hypothetical protein